MLHLNGGAVQYIFVFVWNRSLVQITICVEGSQAKQQQYDQQQKRSRSKKAPKRTAQQRAIRQLEAINPVLVHPEQFKPSTKKKS
ncbi:hypothetical protein VXS05_05185 [Photobacterium toruni]|uniref:hypothetical protein n=1 Tax=Photobacterium toruni TaxID=1935446 RepID=UPI002E17C8C1|nr:hypothetical protein [Photobacterium toruni]